MPGCLPDLAKRSPKIVMAARYRTTMPRSGVERCVAGLVGMGV